MSIEDKEDKLLKAVTRAMEISKAVTEFTRIKCAKCIYNPQRRTYPVQCSYPNSKLGSDNVTAFEHKTYPTVDFHIMVVCRLNNQHDINWIDAITGRQHRLRKKTK